MLRFFRRPDTPTLTQERDALAKFADKHARDVDLLRAECAKLNSAKMDLARQLAEVCRERDDAMSFAHVSGEILTRRTEVLRTIGATASGNGTAQRLARMAREAME
jgi:hypothetical protein